VDPKSVSRDSPEIEGRLTETFEEKSKVGSLAEGEATVSPVTASGRLKVQLEAGVSQSASKKLSFSGAARLMIVTQSQTDDDQYRWTVESRSQRPLAGRPWDAAKEPRLTLIDRRKDKSKSIPPTVRVEVRCKREDIVIEDLEVKDETLWASVKARAGFHNRMAAAESYIRDRLTEEGLEVKNISDIFGELTLASTTAESAGS
jgi:hypothetical protein